jgi:hypothetical protein
MTLRRYVPFLLVLGLALGFVAAMLSMSASADETELSYARIVRLSVVKGDVQIARGNSGKWEPAALNMPVQQGFAVGTNQGLTEIELEHGSVIWVAPNSLLQFTELALSGGGQITKVAIVDGTATFDANIGSRDVFSVSNQDFQITPNGRSEFRLDLTHDGVGVTVLKGKIAFESPQGTQNLDKGQTFFLGVHKPQQSGIKPTPKTDEWDKFVTERSNYIDSRTAQSAQYTNAPFSYGMADLSAFGGWTFVPGMGYAWQPNGVGAGWMPFADGSMMFFNGFGWTWVSAEPWGWVPYHFGQWAYAAPYGWMWMPGNYGQWAPAPVNWVSVGNKVGWTPVANLKDVPESKAPMVVVANHGLNAPDSYKAESSLKASHSLLALPTEPGGDGKLGTAGKMRLVVPTAATLEAFGGNLEAEAKAVDSRPAMGRPPLEVSDLARALAAQNGMPPARLISSRPPARMMAGNGVSATEPGGSLYGNENSSAEMSSRGSPAAPTAVRGSEGGGRPH